MFIAILRFSEGRERQAEVQETHNAWLRRGLDDGVFLLAGGLAPRAGGVILAHGLTREGFDQRLGEDPFVQADVVRPEVLEISPGVACEQLAFLVA
jgi:uncharacterized protein YciI